MCGLWRKPSPARSSFAAPAARRRAQADIRRGTGAQPAHEAWQAIESREGSNDVLKGRLCACRSCGPSRHPGSELRAEQWLAIEWPRPKPSHQVFASDPAGRHPLRQARRRHQTALAHRRDYQELEQEAGLGHYEGRGWREFHHHATLCIAAYGFLISERETIPPSGIPAPGDSKSLPFPIVQDPRDPPLRPQRHVPTRSQRCDADWPPPCSPLRRCPCSSVPTSALMTQSY